MIYRNIAIDRYKCMFGLESCVTERGKIPAHVGIWTDALYIWGQGYKSMCNTDERENPQEA